MRTHRVELMGSAAMPILAGWLAATLGLFAAARQRQRRSRSLGDNGERLAEFEPYTVWGRRHALVLVFLTPVLASGPAWAGAGDEPLKPGTFEWGVVTGYGRSLSVGVSEAGTDFFTFMPRFGYVFTELDWKPPLKGSFEVIGEAPLLVAFEPRESRTIYGGGLTALLAYHIATGTRLVPFVEGGAGILVSAPRSRDPDSQFRSSQFNFTPQVGVGLRYRIGERSVLSLEYRFSHISDGGITERNGGINSHFVLIGFSIFR